MTRIGFCVVLLAAALSSAYAQVSVEVVQDQGQDQFLPGESMPVAVRITNLSGQTLRLGEEEDWLTFSVESREGMVVPKNGDVPVQGEFELESSKVAIKRVDLAPYFPLAEPGRYAITATLRIKQWNRDISSPPKKITVINGAKLWEQDFGVPKAPDAGNAEPEVRKYILQQANYLKGQIRLYLRVTDALGGKVYRVFPIGPMVSFSRPEMQIDQSSNLHVMYQNGAHSFSYTVHNPDGDLLIRQTYDYVNTRPHLRIDKEGKIMPTGGIRRVVSNDVPPPKPAEQSTNSLPATVVSTNAMPTAALAKP